MDLSLIKTEDNTTLEVVHPVTRKTLDLKIVVAGADSARYKAAKQRLLDKRVADIQKRGASSQNAEEIDEMSLVLLVASTVSWTGLDWEGKKLDCTPENVQMVYQTLPWLREQVDACIGDRARFIKDLSKP